MPVNASQETVKKHISVFEPSTFIRHKSLQLHLSIPISFIPLVVSQEFLIPLRIEPANPVESLPQLAGFVDVDLACALSGCLCEVLAVPERL